MVNTAMAYRLGWEACMNGKDGRFTNPHASHSTLAYAWDHGFLDAMEAEDGDAPEPQCVGYGEG